MTRCMIMGCHHRFIFYCFSSGLVLGIVLFLIERKSINAAKCFSFKGLIKLSLLS